MIHLILLIIGLHQFSLYSIVSSKKWCTIALNQFLRKRIYSTWWFTIWLPWKAFHWAHAILDIINPIESNMDNKMYSCSIFIDSKKAFDKVARSILLEKLDHYGVCGVMNDWFAFYLPGQQQIEQLKFVLNTFQKRE